MNIEQICDYLNEIGILDMNNIKTYLTLTTNLLNQNTKYKSSIDIYKISLFAYIKGLNNDDKNLYFLCTNIINSYKRYNLIKKYNTLFHLKKILYYKIFQRFNYFMVSLYKKFTYKSYHLNKYHKNKKNIIQSNTCSNRFYKKKNNIQILSEKNNKGYNTPKDICNNTNNKNKILFSNKEPNNESNNLKNDINLNINELSTIIIDNYNDNNNDIILDKKIYRELIPIKKSKKINNNLCIYQSNINYEKYFINKKVIVCKKCTPSYIEKIKNNKKTLYYESKISLRKNKSETKLRIKKMNYEEKTRSQNFTNIKPELKRKIKYRTKSKQQEEFYKKQKEQQKYNKIVMKEIDNKNIIDRLYTNEIIEKKKEERKQKEEEIKKIKKSPINWDQVYIQTNDKIINNKNNNNIKKNKTCSFFMPNRGRIYKDYENEKNDTNIEPNDNKKINNKNEDNNINENMNNNIIDKASESKIDKINDEENQKISFELDEEESGENKNIFLLNDNNLKNSSKSDKIEEEKEKKKEYNLQEEAHDKTKNFDEDIKESIESIEEHITKNLTFNISPSGFKSKELQEILKRNNSINDLKKNNSQKGTKESIMIYNLSEDDDNDEIIKNKNINEKEENKNEYELKDKINFDYLLSNNNRNNEEMSEEEN